MITEAKVRGVGAPVEEADERINREKRVVLPICHLVDVVNVVFVGRQGHDTCEGSRVKSSVPFEGREEGLEIAHAAIAVKD